MPMQPRPWAETSSPCCPSRRWSISGTVTRELPAGIEHHPATDLDHAVRARARMDQRAAALADLELAAGLVTELHGGGAGRLVLLDAERHRERARANAAGGLVLPGPHVGHVRRRRPHRVHLRRRSELHEVEVRGPL